MVWSGGLIGFLCRGKAFDFLRERCSRCGVAARPCLSMAGWREADPACRRTGVAGGAGADADAGRGGVVSCAQRAGWPAADGAPLVPARQGVASLLVRVRAEHACGGVMWWKSAGWIPRRGPSVVVVLLCSTQVTDCVCHSARVVVGTANAWREVTVPGLQGMSATVQGLRQLLPAVTCVVGRPRCVGIFWHVMSVGCVGVLAVMYGSASA